MNRVIKFRCWNTKTNAWAYGYETLGGFNLFGELNLLGEVRLEDLNDLEVMQFTGLFDKNGKEIYEGDIIRAECEPNGQIHQQTVEWTEAGYWFNEEFGMDYYPPLSDEDIEVEVIGNIYENSDLLV